MNLSAENIRAIRELVRSGYPLKARDAKDLLGHNDHLVELLEARSRLMLGVEIERDQLLAEVAGLKTGYEAFERVNAELKAEVERLDKLLIDASGTLRKASSWICREVEAGTKSATHWAIRLRETADQIDTSLGQGEQS
ncbi:hypothetical protein J1G36_18315 [Pseudomonas carnis]|uniref:hypothetical protein n=1 Tax=Pseudomonas carnis TaxID=2487355 RepID=UPI001CA7526A|nr:hypothetical protein [Pseudomonas carnis]MBY8953849.1 hypothetical protein [Pseudomonas carnis]